MQSIWLSAYACLMVLRFLGPAWSLEIPPLDEFPPENIRLLPIPEAICGEGDDAFYGLLAPKEVTRPDEIYISIMGGAVCYNEVSCRDEDFGDWLVPFRMVQRYASFISFEQYQGLISGAPIPFSTFAALNAAYLAFEEEHPLSGQYGIFIPTCTADGFVGNYVVNYTGGFSATHDGASIIRAVLDALKVRFPNVRKINVVGASGSAVGGQAWLPMIADEFPNANIHLLADSFGHILPATPAYDYFWNSVQWSPNPNGNHTHARKYSNVATPAFDWTQANVIPQMLRRYNGRVKIAYITCTRDWIVATDREKLMGFGNLHLDSNLTRELWDFLINLHQEAPSGTAFSYIQDCDDHHQTRRYRDSGWSPGVPGKITPAQFVEGFIINGSLPEGNYWCCNMTMPITTTTTIDANENQETDWAPPTAFRGVFFVVVALVAMW